MAKGKTPQFKSYEEAQAYFKKHPMSMEEGGALLAHQPLEIQDAFLNSSKGKGAAGLEGKAMREAMTKAIQAERHKAFANGEQLPGVGPAGQGLTNRDFTAQDLVGQNINRGKELEGMVSHDVGDYTYDPALERDIGYRPENRYKLLGGASPEEVALLGGPIDQTRSDTTGIDEQKALLGTYKDLYAKGGLDEIDRARIAQSQRQRGAEYRGAVGAAEQTAEQQGRFGGNAMLLSKLKGAQTMTNARAMDDLQTSALGLQRRNDILSQRGQVANEIQTAQDAIDHFNTQGERDRAKVNMDAMNTANRDEFQEKNRRESVNADQYNHGVDVGFGYDTERQNRNTNRINSAREFNVSPTQGKRGILRDQEGAALITSGAASEGANLLSQTQARHDAAEDAAQAAWIQAGTGILSGGLDAATRTKSFRNL